MHIAVCLCTLSLFRYFVFSYLVSHPLSITTLIFYSSSHHGSPHRLSIDLKAQTGNHGLRRSSKTVLVTIFCRITCHVYVIREKEIYCFQCTCVGTSNISCLFVTVEFSFCPRDNLHTHEFAIRHSPVNTDTE